MNNIELKKANFTALNDSIESKITKKVLSGPYYVDYIDEEDVIALQCCICCLGCWRKCSLRCVRCENFISFPIYCWLGRLIFKMLFSILVRGFHS